MKKIKSIIFAVITLTVITFAFNGCEKKVAESKKEVIKVGAILPMTGEFAFLGEPGRNALQLAQEDFNSKSGITDKSIKVEFYDSKGDPSIGVTAFNRGMSIDEISLFITTLTGVSNAIKPIANENKILQMIIAIFPNIVDNSNYSLRICFNAQQEADSILAFLIKNKIKTVGILRSQDAASEKEVMDIIVPNLLKNNISYKEETFSVGQKDFNTSITKVSSWDIDNLILLGYGSDFDRILQTMDSYKLLEKTNIIGGIGFLELPKGTPDKYLKKVSFISPSFNANQDDNRGKFVQRYREQFNSSYVPYDAGYTYDTFMILLNAISNTNSTDPTKVRDEILRVGSYDGVTGKIKILKNGDSVTDITWCYFDNGKIVKK